MELAPIAFFAYKRPEHTLKSLTSLSQCSLSDQSKLYIFCDGAKSLDDQDSVNQVREIVNKKCWCSQVEIVHRQQNMGLANSIITEVTNLCEKYGQVIVIEDDLVLAKDFLIYMNIALAKYKENKKVMQISGYMFPVDIEAKTDAIFLPMTTSWGWATWHRAWKYFDPEIKKYSILQKDKALRYCFDLYGAYPYFKILSNQIKGKVDSWASVWYLDVFMNQGITLFPVSSLVQNIGFDGSGVHCGVTQIFSTKTYQISSNLEERLPEPVIDKESFKKIIKFLRKSNSFFYKLLRKLNFYNL